MAVDFADFLENQNGALNTPAVKPPAFNFANYLQQTSTTKTLQPAPKKPILSFKAFANKQLPPITGVNGSAAPVPTKQVLKPSSILSTPPSLLPTAQNFDTVQMTPEDIHIQDIGAPKYAAEQIFNTILSPAGQYVKSIFKPGQDEQQFEQQQFTTLGYQKYNPGQVATRYFDRIFRPGVQPLGNDIGQIIATNEIAGQVASGKLPKESLDGIDVLNKSGLQILGDTAQFVMTADSVMKFSDVFENQVDQQATKTMGQVITKTLAGTLVNLGKQGLKEGAIGGFEFGVAQALSSGSKDPKQIAQILVGSVSAGGILGSAMGVAGGLVQSKALSEVIAKVNEQKALIQDSFVKLAMQKGYSQEDAVRLLYQGGYAGGIPDKTQSQPLIEEDGQSQNQPAQERGFITSIKNNPQTAEAIAQNLSGNYSVYTDAAAVSKASQLIAKDRPAAMDLAMSGNFSKDAVTTGMLLYKDANERYKLSTLNGGEIDYKALSEANQIAQHMAEKGTLAGQTVQAFSLLGKDMSNPEDALFAANKFIRQANNQSVPKFEETVTRGAKEIADVNSQVVDQIIRENSDLQLPTKESDGEEGAQPNKTPYNTGNEFVDQLLNYKGEPEPELAKKISDDIKPAKQSKPNLIKDMVNTLFKVAKEDLPAKEKVLPRSPVEFIKEALANKDTYKSVFDKAQGLLLSKYAKDPVAMKKLVDFFQRDLQEDLPIAKSQVSGALKEEMEGQDLNFGDIVKQHFTQVDQTRTDLATKISEQATMDPKDAKALADKIQKRFNELATAKKESLLKQMFKDIDTSQTKTKSGIKELVEMTNLGAFDNSKFRQQVAEKLGLKTLSDADAKIISDRSLNIQTIEDPKERTYQTNLLRKKIADLAAGDSSKLDIATNLWKQGLYSASAKFKIAGEVSNLMLNDSAAFVSTVVDKILPGERTRSFTLGSLGKQIQHAVEAAPDAVSYLKTGVQSGSFAEANEALGKYGISDFQKEIVANNPTLQTMFNAASRILGTTTDYFQNITFLDSMVEQSRVQALNEGLKGKEFNSRVGELLKNSTPEMAENALNHALEMTFQQDSSLAEGAAFIKKGFRKAFGKTVSEISLPIYKTPANIFQTFFVDYNPIAQVLKGIYEGTFGGGYDKQSFVTGSGKTVVGSVFMALGGYLAGKGMMTGNYPTTQSEKAAWAAEGKQTNSVLIDGQWRDVGRVGPFGMLMGLGADVTNLNKDMEGLSKTQQASQLAFGVLDKISEMPMLYGLSGELQAINNPQQSASKYVNTLIGTVVPKIVQNVAQTVDTTKRNPQGVTQQLESEIPGLTGKVPAARDVWGRTINIPGGKWSLIDPFQSSKSQVAPVLDEINRVGVPLTVPDKTIDGFAMSNDEYSYYQKALGYYMYTGLSNVIGKPTYNNLPDDTKKTQIESAKSFASTWVNDNILPLVMMAHYKLPATTNPMAVKYVLTQLNKDPKFKKQSMDQQVAALKAKLKIP